MMIVPQFNLLHALFPVAQTSLTINTLYGPQLQCPLTQNPPQMTDQFKRKSSQV